MPSRQRIAKITLDEHTVVWRSQQVEHERRTAIHDLIEENRFTPAGGFDGPFNIRLAIRDNSLVFQVSSQSGRSLTEFDLSLGSFRAVVRDYFLISESYFNAIKTLSPSRIEAIDMGRKGLHDEGAEMLRERLAGKAEMDLDTARRLFTLICVLHIRA